MNMQSWGKTWPDHKMPETSVLMSWRTGFLLLAAGGHNWCPKEKPYPIFSELLWCEPDVPSPELRGIDSL